MGILYIDGNATSTICGCVDTNPVDALCIQITCCDSDSTCTAMLDVNSSIIRGHISNINRDRSRAGCGYSVYAIPLFR